MQWCDKRRMKPRIWSFFCRHSSTISHYDHENRYCHIDKKGISPPCYIIITELYSRQMRKYDCKYSYTTQNIPSKVSVFLQVLLFILYWSRLHSIFFTIFSDATSVLSKWCFIYLAKNVHDFMLLLIWRTAPKIKK